DGFTQQCCVTGEVLIDNEIINLDTKGSRRRSWGRATQGSQTNPEPLAIAIQVGDHVLEIEFDSSRGQWRGGLRM
nr:hypothetical protein [Acidimicrobiales bacterium]